MAELDQINNPYQEELMGLNRQRALAQALLQRGMQTPQGQMVDGRFVKSSPLQYLGNLAQTASAIQMGNAADKEQAALAQRLRQQGIQEVNDILALQQGTPAKTTELAGPAYQGLAPTAVMPAQEGNTQAALAKALTGISPQSQSLVPTLMQNLLPKKTDKLIEYDTYKKEGGKKSFGDWSKEITPEQQARLDIDRQRLGLEGAKFGLEKQKFAQETNAPKLTETQSNATAFGMRAKESNALLNQLEKDGITNTGITRSAISGTVGMTPFIGDKLEQGVSSAMNVLPNFLGGPNEAQQATDQARRNFVTAVLRKESGAAISPSEFDNEARKYFPQPGDAPSVIKQKQDARELAIKALETQAGPGAKYITAPKKVVNFNDLP